MDYTTLNIFVFIKFAHRDTRILKDGKISKIPTAMRVISIGLVINVILVGNFSASQVISVGNTAKTIAKTGTEFTIIRTALNVNQHFSFSLCFQQLRGHERMDLRCLPVVFLPFPSGNC